MCDLGKVKQPLKHEQLTDAVERSTEACFLSVLSLITYADCIVRWSEGGLTVSYLCYQLLVPTVGVSLSGLPDER